MPAPTELTLRQRIALVLEATTTAEKIVAMDDAEIDHPPQFNFETGV